MAFACMDWTFGSASMRAAEAKYNSRAKDNVYFGVGTYGSSGDPIRGLGNCYRMSIEGVDKPIIAQSVNTGSDVAGNQFDLQIGAGGAGAFNTCAGSASSMYPGTVDQWGRIYGGWDNRADCAKLPKYPKNSTAMVSHGDDLITLCQYGFDKKVRHEGGANPTILDLKRVRCPPELVEFTWFQRSDDPPTGEEVPVKGFESGRGGAAPVCAPPNLAYCLTRMMDCRKPSGAFKDNVRADLTVAGRRLVQVCAADGYARFDVQCGCADCYC